MKRSVISLSSIWQHPHTRLLLPVCWSVPEPDPAVCEAFCHALTGENSGKEPLPLVLWERPGTPFSCLLLVEGGELFLWQALFLLALRDRWRAEGREEEAALADRLLKMDGQGPLVLPGETGKALEALCRGEEPAPGALGAWYLLFRRWLAGHTPPAPWDSLLPLDLPVLLLEGPEDLRRYEAEDPRFAARPLADRLCRHLLLGLSPGRQETLYRGIWCRMADRAEEGARLLQALPLDPRPGESLWEAFLRWEEARGTTGAETLMALAQAGGLFPTP